MVLGVKAWGLDGIVNRSSSAAARLPRLWVRIPQGAWMFVCGECYVLSGRGLCDELITRPEESYRLWWVVGVKAWDLNRVVNRSSYAAARLPRLWVRIPPGAWMFICGECYVLSGRGLCDELITRPEESYRLWWVVGVKSWDLDGIVNRSSYAAARLPRLWVRIPPGAWMFVCGECYVLSGRGLWDELITRPEESYRLLMRRCVWSRNL